MVFLLVFPGLVVAVIVAVAVVVVVVVVVVVILPKNRETSQRRHVRHSAF